MMAKRPTPEEIAEKMADIASIGDPEHAHGEADELMCGLLEQFGYGDAAATFRAMDKWYA